MGFPVFTGKFKFSLIKVAQRFLGFLIYRKRKSPALRTPFVPPGRRNKNVFSHLLLLSVVKIFFFGFVT